MPTLDSAAGLAACLASAAGVDEIVVADGGSRDDSAAIAEAAGARFIEAPRGRGPQLRAGAAAALGDWLLFLHSDTRLGSGWRGVAERHMGESPERAACFRLRLDAPEWQARWIERGVALRAGLLGLPYGDQGLLVPRALYARSGGFRALPLMEDVDLVRRLGGVAVLPADAITSAERWHRDGWLRRSARNFACLGLWRLGMSPQRVAKLYG